MHDNCFDKRRTAEVEAAERMIERTVSEGATVGADKADA
jgi:hypothetical protein